MEPQKEKIRGGGCSKRLDKISKTDWGKKEGCTAKWTYAAIAICLEREKRSGYVLTSSPPLHLTPHVSENSPSLSIPFRPCILTAAPTALPPKPRTPVTLPGMFPCLYTYFPVLETRILIAHHACCSALFCFFSHHTYLHIKDCLGLFYNCILLHWIDKS